MESGVAEDYERVVVCEVDAQFAVLYTTHSTFNLRLCIV